MPSPPRNRERIREFPGLKSNIDPDDLQAGAAQVQINMTSQIDGYLISRKGFRPAAADSNTLVTSLAADA